MRIARWSFMVAGVVLAVVRFVGGSPAERDAEGVLAAFAFGAAVAAPGLVAMVARAPIVLAAAGIGGVVVAMVASFGATLPLAIPAVAIAVVAARGLSRTPLSASTAVAAVLVTVALPWAVVSLFVHEDPATWSTATSTGSTSDVTVWWESLVSLAITVAAIAIARDARIGLTDDPDGTEAALARRPVR